MRLSLRPALLPGFALAFAVMAGGLAGPVAAQVALPEPVVRADLAPLNRAQGATTAPLLALPGTADLGADVPVRLRTARARRVLPDGLVAADAETQTLARTAQDQAEATARAGEDASAEPVSTLPKPKGPASPLVVVGGAIGRGLDAIGAPVKPDRIRIEVEGRRVTIPVPRN